MNLVLACSGCNGYGNRFGVTDSPTKPHMWTDETFVSFRDEVFRRRFDRIAERREQERHGMSAVVWPLVASLLLLLTNALFVAAEAADGTRAVIDVRHGLPPWRGLFYLLRVECVCG